MERRTIGLTLIAIGVIALLSFPLYMSLGWNNGATCGTGMPWCPGIVGQGYQQPKTPSTSSIGFEEATDIAQQYLASLGDTKLAIKEIMEFQYNFYVVYYEKDTGIGAFEMLIWKQAPPQGMMGGGMGMGGGMMGGDTMTGRITPEPGPNMMWNTKYSPMRGMMGSRWQAGASTQMQFSEQDAKSIAEDYLSQNFLGAHLEGITRFYGYYTIDFEKDGKIVGMLSVNGYDGDVWYHSWHGYFVQEKDFS